MLDNDTRGWIMAVVSGIACTFGASIICVDLIVRLFPGHKNFKIEDSNAFLSTGLSLSFGVMIFSSLFSMLPSSKKYLITGGMTPRDATLTMIGFFLLGAFGISILSDILHRYIPHSVVDCDHEHGDEGKVEDEEAAHSHKPMQEQNSGLLQPDAGHEEHSYGTNSDNSKLPRRPSLHTAISTKVSQLVTGQKKALCDEDGQCYGYSDACGAECFKNVQQRPPRLYASKSSQHLNPARPSAANRHQTTQGPHAHDRQLLTLEDVDETTPLMPTRSGPAMMDSSTASLPTTNNTRPRSLAQKHSQTSLSSASSSHSAHSHASHAPQHHHHVPTNAFLAIGLQTSTAIALHKIPEGFITYATNHANPTLGLSIFLALFIHNITEGFALALPLYLAINSRWRAMFWSALLGGVSQPLGAGVAALWFKVAGRGKSDGMGEPGEKVYGCMFAVTAGIMAMVSLQLLGESLDLTHSRKLCFVSAFAGMGILGLSSALTA
ncbi:Zinc transporter [Ascochyta rabiei]|uniref:Metal ion transmembrane transporter n=1 Tax=Didymella rabiei TaxID=5454 RepID=A0A163E5B6_DIDRA|nr:Zinc transporter [Ascochyta rabiei]KZM23527.1 metal ion transmembrane transporter [Ascochyta rabiei]UPX21035.1 Zinc transporter [Ascochyta rabiei]